MIDCHILCSRKKKFRIVLVTVIEVITVTENCYFQTVTRHIRSHKIRTVIYTISISDISGLMKFDSNKI